MTARCISLPHRNLVQFKHGDEPTHISNRLPNLLWAVLVCLCLATLTGAAARAQTVAAGISANPTSISPGASTTLTWTTQNAVSADLNGTTVALNGSQVVSPTATTTYRITGHAPGGSTAQAQAVVTVTAGGPPTASISANPTSITVGGSSTLTWTSTNATSATLNGYVCPIDWLAGGVSNNHNQLSLHSS